MDLTQRAAQHEWSEMTVQIRSAIRAFVGLMSLALLSLAACAELPPAPPTAAAERRAMHKINFDLSEIDEHGLIGPEGGKRRVAYEFCIPREPAKLEEVKAIDPSLTCYPSSPGRIGCARDQYLCIGQGGIREVLLKLASLDYVERIDPFYGE